MLKMTRRISLISEVEVDVINEELRGKISRRIPFALELGSGTSPRKGYYHLDLVALPGIDIVADLNNGLDGIPDEIVSDLYSWHTLEHVTNFLHLMEEIHRVCLPNARVTIVVPHYSNGFGYSDPTHVRFLFVFDVVFRGDGSSAFLTEGARLLLGGQFRLGPGENRILSNARFVR